MVLRINLPAPAGCWALQLMIMSKMELEVSIFKAFKEVNSIFEPFNAFLKHGNSILIAYLLNAQGWIDGTCMQAGLPFHIPFHRKL